MYDFINISRAMIFDSKITIVTLNSLMQPYKSSGFIGVITHLLLHLDYIAQY